MAVQDNMEWKALYARNVELHAEINTLQSRLKLAEAVCETYGQYETSRAQGRNPAKRRALAYAYGTWHADKEKDDGGS